MTERQFFYCGVPVSTAYMDHGPDGNDDPGTCRWGEPEQCGAELYVNWSFSVPVDDEITTSDQVAKAAVSACWELECTEGHRLARSTINDGYDYPEPFNPAALLPHLPVVKGPAK